MQLSWQDMAEGWPVTLADFLGADEATLPDFEPFDRLTADYRGLSLDPFAVVRVPELEGLRIHLLKSTLPHCRQTAVLVEGGERVGYVARHPAGCDVVSLAPRLRSHGLAVPLILGARSLRARLQYAAIVDLRLASKTLFCGGSYSPAGLASVRAAHRVAVARALRAGKPVRLEVLDAWPADLLSLTRPGTANPLASHFLR
jgi:hypothetical protein